MHRPAWQPSYGVLLLPREYRTLYVPTEELPNSLQSILADFGKTSCLNCLLRRVLHPANDGHLTVETSPDQLRHVILAFKSIFSCLALNLHIRLCCDRLGREAAGRFFACCN